MTHRRSPPAAQTYISRSFLYESRGALGANYGAIHKSKSLMARLSLRLFKRDPVFYIISQFCTLDSLCDFSIREESKVTEEVGKIEREKLRNFSYACAREPPRSVIRRRYLRFSSAFLFTPGLVPPKKRWGCTNPSGELPTRCTWAS